MLIVLQDEQRFPEPTLTEFCEELKKISDNTDYTSSNFKEILLAKVMNVDASFFQIFFFRS